MTRCKYITRDDNMVNINNHSKMLSNMGIKKPNITTAKCCLIDYMEYLKNRGYDREKICIDETYTDIVTRLSLAKGAIGTVINVRCPPSYKMVVIGSSQLQQYQPFSAKADHEDAVQIQQQGAVLPEEYDTDVSSIMIRLANTENIEIDPDVRIKITKEKVSQSVSIIDTMFYKDISSTAYTKTSATTAKCSLNEIKKLEEQYVFDRGIEINGGEHIKIEVIKPNICIDCMNTRLEFGIDIWEQG